MNQIINSVIYIVQEGKAPVISVGLKGNPKKKVDIKIKEMIEEIKLLIEKYNKKL